MRFLPILVWVEAQKPTLKTKVDKRIVEMLRDGGMQEAFELFDKFTKHDAELRFDKGLLQAIGYKELYPAYKLGEHQHVYKHLASELKLPQEKAAVVEACITQLQSKTMSYANYQLRWL